MKARPATVCTVLSLLTIGFAPEPAMADVVAATSGGGVTQDSRGQHVRGGRNGRYNLEAFAQDSVNGPDGVSIKPGPAAYTPGPGPFTATTGPATDTGLRWAPTATATINYTAAKWDSSGSSVNAVAPGPRPDSKEAETTQAKAVVRDPYFFDPLPFDAPITFTITFHAGLEVSALATGSDHAGASFHSDASTDLSGLGDLWSLNWSADGSAPGGSAVDFDSHPALGLDDDAFLGAFVASISSNPLTGQNLLVQDVSFFYTLLIPANQTPSFSGSMAYSAAAAMPEPGTLVLLAVAPLLAGRRWKKS